MHNSVGMVYEKWSAGELALVYVILPRIWKYFRTPLCCSKVRKLFYLWLKNVHESLCQLKKLEGNNACPQKTVKFQSKLENNPN